MMVGHLPAGYLYGSFLATKLARTQVDSRYILIAALAGSVFPDIDMFYFLLIDDQRHHHSYWTHYPIVWLSIVFASSIVFSLYRKWRRAAVLSMVFASTAVLHLILDSIVGDVRWLAPFVDQAYTMFSVPARYEPWWFNFIFHWSFGLEILLSVWALWHWRKHRLDV